MIEELDQSLAKPPYSVPQAARDHTLLSGLNRLTRLHYERCLPYLLYSQADCY